jgi:transposase
MPRLKLPVTHLSATYKAVFDSTVPHAIQVADPFHVVKHATFQLDQCRRRVQQEFLGHRGAGRAILCSEPATRSEYYLDR